MTKKLVQIHQFDPVIYPVKLFVVKDTTPEVIQENFQLLNGDSLNTDRHIGGYAMTYSKIVENKKNTKLGVLIRLFGKQSASEMAHEATHAARVIWDWLCENGTGAEVDAYLVGWIVDCLDQVNKNKFKTS